MKLKNLKFKDSNKNKLLFWNNQKMMKLKGTKHMINMAHQSHQQKKIYTVDREDKSRKNVVREANTSTITAKGILTHSTKQRNQKHSTKHLIPPNRRCH